MYLFVELLHIETRWVIKGISSESAKIQTPESRSSKLNHSLSFLKVHINVKLIYYIAVWWMRVDNESLLSSISAFKKNSNSTQFIELYFGVSEQINLYNPLIRRQSSSLSPSLSPCQPVPVIWQSLLKTIWENKRRIWLPNWWPSSWSCTLAHWHSLGWSDRQAQTQGVAELAAVTVGSYLVAWGKRATTLVILTQFNSQIGFNALQILGCDKSTFFYVKWNFQWNWLEVVADKSSAHCFAQSCNHSLVSE